MQARFEAVQQQLNSTKNLLCTDKQSCVGWGVDLFDGRITNVMVRLTADSTDPTKTWRHFIAPKEVQFTPIQNPQASFATGAGVFAVPSAVASYIKVFFYWLDFMYLYFNG